MRLAPEYEVDTCNGRGVSIGPIHGTVWGNPKSLVMFRKKSRTIRYVFITVNYMAFLYRL